MSFGDDGDILLSSVFDKYLPPSIDLLNDVNSNSDDFLSDGLSPSLEESPGQSKDQLSLLMRDLDFDFIDTENQKNPANNFGILDEFSCGKEADYCTFPKSSPLSSDSGNHSPSSTSSEGIQFAEVWQESSLRRHSAFDDDILRSTNSDCTATVANEQPLQVPINSSSENPIRLDAGLLPNTSCVIPVQVPTAQIVPPQQSVLYLIPASTSKPLPNQHDVCLRTVSKVPVHTLSENNLIGKATGSCILSSNRMQPYAKNRPQLLIPKPEVEVLNSLPVVAKPLVNALPLGSSALLTSLTGSKIEPTLGNAFLLPIPSNPAANADCMTKKFSNDAEEYARKREERKIKNRASAQQSRLRKRYELDEMKQKLSEREKSICKLQSENEELKKQIDLLQNENSVLKKNLVSFKGRAGAFTGFACLMAVFVFSTSSSSVTSNMSKNVAISADISQRIDSRPSTSLHSRSLLSVDFNSKLGKTLNLRQKSVANDLAVNNETSVSMLGRNDSNNYACGDSRFVFLNQTERIRVNNDLSSWVDRHERLMFLQMRRVFRAPMPKLAQTNSSLISLSSSNPKSKKPERIQILRRSASVKMEEAKLKASRERAWRHLDLISNTGKPTPDSNSARLGKIDINMFGEVRRRLPLQVAEEERLRSQNAETRYLELARAIKQKEDTLYVVAMKDYYLLPVTDRNSTNRPRVSLILPAFSYNGTLPNQVAMMRIDCEVTGTGLFHISDSLLLFFYNQSYYNQ